MTRPVRPIVQHVHAAAARLLVAALGWAPRRGALALGEALGRLWYRLDARHRRIGRVNLRIAFPEWTEEERERILRRSLEHAGRLAVEVAQSRRWDEAEIRYRLRLEDPGSARRVRELHDRAGGLLFFTAHVGVWELIPLYWAIEAAPMDIVVRPIDNPAVDRLVTSLRERWGNRTIGKHGALQEILRSARRGNYIAMLVDQNATRANGIFIDFFGKPACSLVALPLLSLRTGLPMIGGFAHYDPHQDVHWLRVEEGVAIEPSGDRTVDLRRLTQEMHARVETVIRAYPDQWLWMHRRWRTRPEGEQLPPLYDRN